MAKKIMSTLNGYEIVDDFARKNIENSEIIELLSENIAKTFVVGTDIHVGETLKFVTPFDESTNTGVGSEIKINCTDGSFQLKPFPSLNLAVIEEAPETVDLSLAVEDTFVDITVDEYVTVYRVNLTARGELEKKFAETKGTDVTSENIKTALGYTPASKEELGQLEEQIADKADIDDVYVEVETDTAEVMAVSNEGIAVASVEEYTFTSSDAVKNYVAKTASCSKGSDVPIYVTSVKIHCYSTGTAGCTECKFSIWEYTKRYPGDSTNKEYIFTKVRDCGSVVPNNDLAEISFPNGELVEPNQLMLASALTSNGAGALAYGSKDYENPAICYAYSVDTTTSVVGDNNVISTLDPDWTAVFTTTYTLEPPENTGGDTEITHTITNNLENASNSNSETSVVDGSSYTANITANSGYTLKNVTITMGGIDVTSSVYSNGTINISSVTGDVIITATTTAQSTGTTYTVTNSLTNVSSSNSATSIVGGSAYVANLSANSGYVLSSVIVTMGGTDITASVYSNGRINISNVSGNIKITATAIVENTGGNTSKRKIKEVIPEMLADIKALKTSAGNSNSGSAVSNSRSTRKSINKYFTLTVDDVEAPFLTIADRLIEIGFYPALALKMESINQGGITWDDVRTLQNMGFEIAFHGMLHSHTPAGTAPNNDSVMLADIAEYKALCKDNGIDIVGYCGPNHYPLPVDAFKEFEWARSPYGLTAYGADYRLTDSFASLTVWSCELTGSATMEETKASMIAQADNLADNQYLTPMCHSQNIVAYIDDYMEVFNAWIEKGLSPMRCRDAVKQSLWEHGGIGQNSTFEIQAGTATAPYWVVGGNGIVRSNQGTE